MKRFPFAAITGQDRLKIAYLVNITNPEIGGLLISGVKGTGKSTLVRSVQGILPEYSVVRDCPFNCDPDDSKSFCSLCQERGKIEPVQQVMDVVNLPLSVSEDRLIGSIDIETLMKTGEKNIQVGVLGQANRNILYIDEVNLLPDHIVDDILDAAASRWNTIEREGFSISHPAAFVLIGTMNPEEGDLRPQILDRFALGVTVDTVTDPEQRVRIVKSNLLFESDPQRFIDGFAVKTQELKEQIISARNRLPSVAIPETLLLTISTACAELKVDGQRPDIVIVRVARSTAALEGRTLVEIKDILLAAVLALSHRTRDGGLLGPPTEDEITAVFTKHVPKRADKTQSTFTPEALWQDNATLHHLGISPSDTEKKT